MQATLQIPAIRRTRDGYQTFNTNRPGDFHGHSLSVSDIVADRTAWYPVTTLIHGASKNCLDSLNRRTTSRTRMVLKDDYGIDGIGS